MNLKVIQTIWIAEDYNIHKTVCATPYFKDLIDILCDEGYIHESTYTTERATLKELYGENWLKTLKSFNARKIKNLIDWDLELRVVDVVQIERS